MRSSHGSQNLAGAAPDVLAGCSRSRRSPCSSGSGRGSRGAEPSRDGLAAYAAAVLTAFVALGKVLSPQFLIWLVPVVPLVAAARANALLARALVLTQLWFPYRYWDLVREFDPVASWLVLARDLVLVALLVVLVSWPSADANASRSDVARPSGVHSTRAPSIRTPPCAVSKRTREPGAHARDRLLGLDADHRVVRPGHARVGERGRAARVHARVVRLHVRVRADHRRHAPVEPPRERDLLARRLGVHVDEDHRRPLARLLDELVDHLERVVRDLEEEAP